jgi:hypothetical protein
MPAGWTVASEEPGAHTTQHPVLPCRTSTERARGVLTDGEERARIVRSRPVPTKGLRVDAIPRSIAAMSVATKLEPLEVLDVDGNPQRLGDLWSGRRLVLVFVRHFG